MAVSRPPQAPTRPSDLPPRSAFQVVQQMLSFLSCSSLPVVREALKPYCRRSGRALPGSVAEGVHIAVDMVNCKGTRVLGGSCQGGRLRGSVTPPGRLASAVPLRIVTPPAHPPR